MTGTLSTIRYNPNVQTTLDRCLNYCALTGIVYTGILYTGIIYTGIVYTGILQYIMSRHFVKVNLGGRMIHRANQVSNPVSHRMTLKHSS